MTTFEKLITVFNNVFEDEVNTESVAYESSLKDDIGINSIGMIYMAMALEEEFGVKFRNEDLMELKTVGDVIDCIEKKLG